MFRGGRVAAPPKRCTRIPNIPKRGFIGGMSPTITPTQQHRVQVTNSGTQHTHITNNPTKPHFLKISEFQVVNINHISCIRMEMTSIHIGMASQGKNYTIFTKTDEEVKSKFRELLSYLPFNDITNLK